MPKWVWQVATVGFAILSAWLIFAPKKDPQKAAQKEEQVQGVLKRSTEKCAEYKPDETAEILRGLTVSSLSFFNERAITVCYEPQDIGPVRHKGHYYPKERVISLDKNGWLADTLLEEFADSYAGKSLPDTMQIAVRKRTAGDGLNSGSSYIDWEPASGRRVSPGDWSAPVRDLYENTI